jgi:hypothetical protein
MSKSKLPPLGNQNYPVDVTITIVRAGSKYEMSILAVGKTIRAPIDMTDSDLSSLNIRLHNAIRAAITDDDQDAKFSELTETSHYAFNRVFSDPEARKAILQLAPMDSRTNLRIVTEDFFLPWELLYPVSVYNEPLSNNNFWGANHLISRVVDQGEGASAFVPDIISTPSLPRLGLLTYKELEYVKKKEIPFFEQLESSQRIKLFKLRVLNPEDKRSDELKVFKVFLDSSLDIAHFACHACYDQNDPDLSKIILSNNFQISIQDLENIETVLKDNPLVILNACETSTLNPLFSSFFAKRLLKYGARGVVATECAVPDNFASEFAERFYRYFLRGYNLGDALLNTRSFFIKTGNIGGLLYSLYASPAIRLSMLALE